MIGKLTGIVDSRDEDSLIVDVGGVGYLVHCSTRTLAGLKMSETVSLAIDTHVREDMIRLYGFASATERDWFRLLQTVQGVGAKVALGILGTLSSPELSSAIASGDRTAVARAQGVGPKLAARIVAELKDKGPEGAAADLGLPGHDVPTPLGGPAADAVSALVNLGYARPQAISAVASAVATLGEEAATAALIRAGLKQLAM